MLKQLPPSRLTSKFVQCILKMSLPKTSPGLQKMSTDATCSDVILETVCNKGLITLNRPKALNALTLSMVRTIYPQLDTWENDVTTSMVIIKGAGDKAFCAGGDIVALLAKTPEAAEMRRNFFKEEYILNNEIGTLQIPYVALIDGITMGGGVGLSVHGTFRVATERTVFAMPETAIGLFPDVGGSYFLSRFGGSVGVYLALTGFRLKGRDVHKAGIATHYVTSDRIPKLEHELINMQTSKPADVSLIGQVLDRYHRESIVQTQFVLAPHVDDISRIFSAHTAEEIVERLRQDDSDWSRKQLETLSRMSPTSVKITLRQILEGAQKDLQECLEMEYRLSQRFMDDHDFFEGVRAVLVDKDNKPCWRPAQLAEVSDSVVDHYFSPLEADKELVL